MVAVAVALGVVLTVFIAAINDAIWLIPVGLAMTGLAAALADRQRQKRIDRTWHEFARRLGGILNLGRGYGLVPRGGWKRPSTPRSIEQAPNFPGLVVDHTFFQGEWAERALESVGGEVSHNASGRQSTRLRKKAIGSVGLRLLIRRKNIAGRLVEALGMQSTPTGHARFDDAYTVACNQPERIGLWLTEPIRRSLLSVHGYRFDLKNGRWRALHEKLETDVERLLRVAHTMLLLAQPGEQWRARWLAFAEANGGTGQGDRDEYDLQHSGVVLRLRHAHEQVGLEPAHAFTELRANRIGAERESFVFAPDVQHLYLPEVAVAGSSHRYRVGSNDPAGTLRRIDPALMKRIDALAPRALEADESYVVMRLDGVEFQPERMESALQIMVHLAQQSTNVPYR